MGAMQNNPKSTRGKRNKGKQGLKKIGKGTNAERSVSKWQEIPYEHLIWTVYNVTESGGAIMFLKTSDGGALGIKIYHDEYEKTTLYGQSSDGEMLEVLAMVISEFGGVEDGEANE